MKAQYDVFGASGIICDRCRQRESLLHAQPRASEIEVRNVTRR